MNESIRIILGIKSNEKILVQIMTGSYIGNNDKTVTRFLTKKP